MLAVAALAAGFTGCGLPVGGTLNTGTSTLDDEKGQQYAFSRARVPITVEGMVSPKRLALPGTPAFTHKVTISIRPAKYALDTGLAKSLGRKPGDRFTADIDATRQLRSVSAAAPPAGTIVTGAAAPATAAAVEIADFSALLEKALPAGPATAALSRTLPRALPAFRIDTEIDPAAPGELATLQAELVRVARDWGLKVTFEPVTVSADLNGRKVTLAAGQSGGRCGDPICFRVPVPYRLKVEPSESGWRGKLEAHVWLPNNGPIGSLDVRNPLFVESGARATFANGMLRSVAARDVRALDMLLRVPSMPETAAAR